MAAPRHEHIPARLAATGGAGLCRGDGSQQHRHNQHLQPHETWPFATRLGTAWAPVITQGHSTQSAARARGASAPPAEGRVALPGGKTRALRDADKISERGQDCKMKSVRTRFFSLLILFLAYLRRSLARRKACGHLCSTSPFPRALSICRARYLDKGPVLPLYRQGYRSTALCRASQPHRGTGCSDTMQEVPPCATTHSWLSASSGGHGRVLRGSRGCSPICMQVFQQQARRPALRRGLGHMETRRQTCWCNSVSTHTQAARHTCS